MITTRPKLLIIGDSHASVFKHKRFQRIFKRFEFRLVSVGGATVSGLDNPNSTTNANHIFYSAYQKFQPDIVITLLGEVDTGFVLWFKAEKNSSDVAPFLTMATANYEKLISDFGRLSNIICISTPLPTIRDGDTLGEVANLRMSIKASQVQRTELTLGFNQHMRNFCVAGRADYLDLDGDSLNPTTGVVTDTLLNANQADHHYDWESYIDLLEPKLQTLLEKLFPSSIRPKRDYLVSKLPTRLYLELKWLDYKWSRNKDFKETQKLRLKQTTNYGSYKPFDDKQAIFVHIPKCAGISVNKALFGNLAGGHTSLDQYTNIFEPSNFLKYFKFTIVRNPWDRLVSAYFFLCKGGYNRWDSDFYEKELRAYSSFREFVLEWLTKPENLYKHHHFRPQTHYIFDRYRKVTVDFVGYFEDIERDFSYIADHIVGAQPLPKTNSSNRGAYLDYFDDEMTAVVQRVYRDDIKYLGYRFDGYERPEHLKSKD